MSKTLMACALFVGCVWAFLNHVSAFTAALCFSAVVVNILPQAAMERIFVMVSLADAKAFSFHPDFQIPAGYFEFASTKVAKFINVVSELMVAAYFMEAIK